MFIISPFFFKQTEFEISSRKEKEKEVVVLKNVVINYLQRDLFFFSLRSFTGVLFHPTNKEI
jgi:hypothetical protein